MFSCPWVVSWKTIEYSTFQHHRKIFTLHILDINPKLLTRESPNHRQPYTVCQSAFVKKKKKNNWEVHNNKLLDQPWNDITNVKILLMSNKDKWLCIQRPVTWPSHHLNNCLLVTSYHMTYQVECNMTTLLNSCDVENISLKRKMPQHFCHDNWMKQYSNI